MVGSYATQIEKTLLDAVDRMVPDEPTGSPIHPIVEVSDGDGVVKTLIKRSSKEYCFIEASKNSIRISISFKQQFSDPLEQAILAKYMQFFQRRADDYKILRRKPIRNTIDAELSFCVSFLLTNEHVEKHGGEMLVATILDFMSQIDKECSHLKISINAHARHIATDFLKSF